MRQQPHQHLDKSDKSIILLTLSSLPNETEASTYNPTENPVWAFNSSLYLAGFVLESSVLGGWGFSTHLVLTVGADCIDWMFSKPNPGKSCHGNRGLLGIFTMETDLGWKYFHLNYHNLRPGVNLRGEDGLTWKAMIYPLWNVQCCQREVMILTFSRCYNCVTDWGTLCP